MKMYYVQITAYWLCKPAMSEVSKKCDCIRFQLLGSTIIEGELILNIRSCHTSINGLLNDKIEKSYITGFCPSKGLHQANVFNGNINIGYN